MATTVLDDFERRRRARETANERIVCLVVAGSAMSLLLTQVAWNALLADDTTPADQELLVSRPVELATVAMLVAHLAVLLLLALRPAYDPSRKYMLVVMRVALMGLMCWAQWFNRRPSFGLLVPSEMFMMVIVLSGLTFSRRAVLLAGGLSAITYCTMTLLGPVWPLSVRASVLSVQGFGFATAITFYIVDGMLRMHAASVSNERLSRFFAPDVAARIAGDPDVAVRVDERGVTVLFCDISGFTAMSAAMQPRQVVELLNAYFPPMVDIVFRRGGTLEKFIGDALLAVWGAPFGSPDDADRAVAAALEMQGGITALNARLVAAGCAPIGIHIGLCSGPVAAGYIGTEKYIQFAVIGDTTNVASRACSVAESGEILVTESTRLLLTRPGITLERLPPVTVKGKSEPLVLHRVLTPPESTA